MRSVWIDRAMVVWIAAAQVVWLSCLVILWQRAFDASGESALIATAAALLSVSLAAPLPGRIARAILRLAGRPAVAIALYSAGGGLPRAKDIRRMMRLLAASSVLAAAGGVLSTGAVFGAAALVGPVNGWILLSSGAWAAVKLAAETVGFLPLSLGMAVSFLASAMLRGGSGRDVYATAFREWLWGMAAGLALFGACRLAGVHVLGLAVSMAMVLLGGALVVGFRPGMTTRPPRSRRPTEPLPLRRAVGVAAAFAILAAAILFQVRFAGDALALGTGGGAIWLAVSAGLLAGFLRVADRKSHPPSWRQRNGAAVGAQATLLLQASLLATALQGGAVGVVCVVLVAAGQVPLAALAGVVLSSQRRLFATAGGRPRAYLSAAALGAAAGILAYVVIAHLPHRGLIVLTAMLGLLAAWTVVSVARARNMGEQVGWAAGGVVLLVAMAAGLLGGIGQATRWLGHASPGEWLTLVRQGPTGCRVLPCRPRWRSVKLDAAVSSVLGGHKGKWLLATLGGDGSGVAMPPGVYGSVCVPDPTAVPPMWKSAAAGESMFDVGRASGPRFDGVLIDLLPADHPAAWRCYSVGALRGLIGRVQRDGVAVMRLGTRSAGLPTALAAASAFCDAVGPCWIVADFGPDCAELLLVGPAGAYRARDLSPDAVVVAGRQFWYEFPLVRPLTVARPVSLLNRRSMSEFASRVRALDRK